MSSLGALLLFAGGLVLVVAGAELFFDGILAAAERLHVSPFVITVVVSGFELENLVAGIAADLKGLPGAAAGTFLGGTTFLALGVAGVAGLIAPIRARLPTAVLVWTAVAPAPLAVLSLDGRLSRTDGALLVVWFAIGLVGLARSGRFSPPAGPHAHRLWALKLLAGLGLLAGGGDLLGEGIQNVVRRLGISQTLLGNTVIAAAVEGEEIARVAVPAKRQRGDLALANIVGTIVHFVALNAGVIALVKPLNLDQATLYLHLPAAATSVLALCALLAMRGGISRPAATGLLALYTAYVAAAIFVA
jgi:cation:H+ antiporter